MSHAGRVRVVRLAVVVSVLVVASACGPSGGGAAPGASPLPFIRIGSSPWSEVPSDLAGVPSRLVFVSNRSGSYEIYSMRPNGSDQRLLTRSAGQDSWPSLSPDGERVAFASTVHGNTDVYTINVDGSALTRLTTSPEPDYHPAWSPDGTRIAFESMRDGDAEIYVMNADGSDPVNLTHDPALDGSPAWSPDGTRIAFESIRSGDYELYTMAADGSDVRRLTHARGEDTDPAWSPDGGTIAFSSSRLGQPRLFVMDPDGSTQIMVSPPPSRLGPGVEGDLWMDANPTWSPDGSWLAFDTTRSGHLQIWAMRPDGEPAVALTGDGNAGTPSWGGV